MLSDMKQIGYQLLKIKTFFTKLLNMVQLITFCNAENFLSLFITKGVVNKVKNIKRG